MNSAAELAIVEHHYVNFHITYTSTHLAWFQFFKKNNVAKDSKPAKTGNIMSLKNKYCGLCTIIQ